MPLAHLILGNPPSLQLHHTRIKVRHPENGRGTSLDRNLCKKKAKSPPQKENYGTASAREMWGFSTGQVRCPVRRKTGRREWLNKMSLEIVRINGLRQCDAGPMDPRKNSSPRRGEELVPKAVCRGRSSRALQVVSSNLRRGPGRTGV